VSSSEPGLTALPPSTDDQPSRRPPVALEAVGLCKSFRAGGRGARQDRLRALADVSIRLRQGEITALIGESGSGKSTLARVLAQLERQDSGQLFLNGAPVRHPRRRAYRRYVQQVQLIFQDPFASLNPMRSVYDHVLRPLRLRGLAGSRSDATKRIASLLNEVQLTPPAQMAVKYPHELSGGQRQRVSIARALAAEPSVVLADEPISMLDVSMRLGVLNLLRDIVEHRSVALLYITHDIASARYFARNGLVMYAGRVVEEGTCADITRAPAHPYTRLLLASAPDIKSHRKRSPVSWGGGEPPSLSHLPPGCSFAPRCPEAMPLCQTDLPPLIDIDGARSVRCWLYRDATPIQLGPKRAHDPTLR
jgi:peptide/nickel transport system ATP-binding protein